MLLNDFSTVNSNFCPADFLAPEIESPRWDVLEFGRSFVFVFFYHQIKNSAREQNHIVRLFNGNPLDVHFANIVQTMPRPSGYDGVSGRIFEGIN